MTTIEPRYPCPVCLGATLNKLHLARGQARFVIDLCPRCGGIWFDAGEVQRLRAQPPKALWSAINRRMREFRMLCHECTARIGRNDEVCRVCGWHNRIECPRCTRAMSIESHHDLRLDLCRQCKGVWFDHVELDAIWQGAFAAKKLSVQRRNVVASSAVDVGGGVGEGLAEAILYSPDLFVYGAQSAGMTVQEGAASLANAPEFASVVVESVGNAAGGVFDAVLSAIGELLGGLDF